MPNKKGNPTLQREKNARVMADLVMNEFSTVAPKLNELLKAQRRLNRRSFPLTSAK